MKNNKSNRPELKFRFHNLNSLETTVNLIVNVFYEVQFPRVKKAIDEELMAMAEAENAASEKEEKPPPEKRNSHRD